MRILTEGVKQMLLSVQRLERGSDVESFVISNDYGYNGIQSRVVSIHEPNLLVHFYCETGAVANHSKPRDCVDDANHTWEIKLYKRTEFRIIRWIIWIKMNNSAIAAHVLNNDLTWNVLGWLLHSLVHHGKYDSHRSTSSAFEMRMRDSCASGHAHFQLACGWHIDLNDSNDSCHIDDELVWSSLDSWTMSIHLKHCQKA